MPPEQEEYLARLNQWRAVPQGEQIRAMGALTPPRRSRFLSFARSLLDHLRDGGRKASREIQQARAAECGSNACGMHLADVDACRACGCGVDPALSFVGLNLKRKRKWASSRCPLDPPRWGPV